MKKVTYINRKEKWWFYATRRMNLFAFRFWWLVLLLFFLGLYLFYFFCSRDKDTNCEHYRMALNSTNRARENSSNCCNCLPPQGVIPCNTQTTENGGQGYHENTHFLGDSPGKVRIQFDMYNQKDKMDVYYDNQLVASTNGVVAGLGTLEFTYSALSGKPKYCTIIMTAPESGTSWEYYLACPQ